MAENKISKTTKITKKTVAKTPIVIDKPTAVQNVIQNVVESVVTNEVVQKTNNKKTIPKVQKNQKISQNSKKTNKKRILKEINNETDVKNNQTVVSEQQTTEEENGSRNRFFKLIEDTENAKNATGRYSGNKPKQAANKALTAIIKRMDATDVIGKEIVFRIKECTRGSKQKIYTYTGFRQQLDKPMKVKIGIGDDEKFIEYKFTNKIKKYPKVSN